MSEDQIKAILSAIKSLENKFDKRLDSVDKRLVSIEGRLTNIEADLDKIEAWTGYKADHTLPKVNGKAKKATA